MSPRVLVTDGGERASLAAVRSLGRAGYEVGVTARTARCLAGASRHAGRTWGTPDPLTEPSAYVEALRGIVREAAIDLLLPMTEVSLLAVLPRREELAGVRIPFPPYDRFRAITDKARVVAEASEVGIAAPRQKILEGPDLACRRTLEALNFPLVLKPARSVGETCHVQKKVGVVHVHTPEGLPPALEQLPPQAYPLLVQERIDGIGAGVFLLVRDGHVVASFAHRRIREKPPSGGVSVCRESVAADPALVESSRALLERFGWEGVAMVEYKIQDGSGEPYIMEVNPRFWGSLQLAVDAGVDFPRLLVDAALGKNVEPVTTYELAVRSRWWWGEVDHLVARVKEAHTSHGVVPAIRQLTCSIRDLLRGWGGQTRSEVWAGSDPAPFLRETMDWLRGR